MQSLDALDHNYGSDIEQLRTNICKSDHSFKVLSYKLQGGSKVTVPSVTVPEIDAICW